MTTNVETVLFLPGLGAGIDPWDAQLRPVRSPSLVRPARSATCSTSTPSSGCTCAAYRSVR